MAVSTKVEAFWMGFVGFIVALFVVGFLYFAHSSVYWKGYNDAEQCIRYQFGCYKIKEIVSK